MNQKWLSLCLDCAMMVVAIVLGAGVFAVPLGVHEWLGVVLVAALVVHLLLQWPCPSGGGPVHNYS